MSLLFEFLKLVFAWLAFIAVVTGATIGVTTLTGDIGALKAWVGENKASFYILLGLSFIVYAMAWTLDRAQTLVTKRVLRGTERQNARHATDRDGEREHE